MYSIYKFDVQLVKFDPLIKRDLYIFQFSSQGNGTYAVINKGRHQQTGIQDWYKPHGIHKDQTLDQR